MNSKSVVMIGLAIGSIVGGYIPVLWGVSTFSLVSLIGSFVGGALGIWVGFKISQSL